MTLIRRLADEAGMTEEEAKAVLAEASRKYKVFTIAKRSGGRRVIAQPAQDLKRLQRAFVSLFPLPVHAAVMSYREGISIRNNAEKHKEHRYLLKTDFHRFFPSLKPAAFWQQTAAFSSEDWAQDLLQNRQTVEALLFWRPARKVTGKLVLSIGAPSSPSVSNFCLYTFDQALSEWCGQSDVIYTRYADDLTFSTDVPGRLQQVYHNLKQLLRKERPYLVLNASKTVFASKRTNRHVTGLVISNEGHISLGRDKKRRLKALVHQAALGKLDAETLESLRGWLNFSAGVEPEFLTTLIKKYTLKTVTSIRHGD